MSGNGAIEPIPLAANGYGGRAGPPGIQEIKAAVSASTRIPVEAIDGKSREADICRARHIVMWLAHRLTEKSYPQIGRALNRDHTTVMHGVSKVEHGPGLRAAAREIAAGRGWWP